MPARKKYDNGKPKDQGITAITVQGFKSIAEETTIEIRPLTILAGANSSGKSSIMQPLLMLKQTLEEMFDPGPLLINGFHVKYTSFGQFMTIPNKKIDFKVRICTSNLWVENQYSINKASLTLSKTIFKNQIGKIDLLENMDHSDLLEQLKKYNQPLLNVYEFYKDNYDLHVNRNRCFFEVIFKDRKTGTLLTGLRSSIQSYVELSNDYFSRFISEVLHSPGIRGNPERSYNRVTVESKYPGIFSGYLASLILKWQDNKSEQNEDLNKYLNVLGLNSGVKANPKNQVEIELLVNRFPSTSKSKTSDLVNIADVGFGVSQVLPVLVALLAAEPGQLVYIEQPELHLHPRAQVAMAEVLVDAAKRGVKVVAETHSSSLLLGIQTAVAEGRIPPDLVKLHWFERRKNGITKVTSADLDEQGRFGDWPEDFGDVELKAQSRYLDASLKL